MFPYNSCNPPTRNFRYRICIYCLTLTGFEMASLVWKLNTCLVFCVLNIMERIQANNDMCQHFSNLCKLRPNTSLSRLTERFNELSTYSNQSCLGLPGYHQNTVGRLRQHCKSSHYRRILSGVVPLDKLRKRSGKQVMKCTNNNILLMY